MSTILGRVVLAYSVTPVSIVLDTKARITSLKYFYKDREKFKTFLA